MSGEASIPNDEHTPATVRFRFGTRHRLSGAKAYNAVHRQGVRKPRGPIIVIGLTNDLPYCRLGLSVSRRVGNAVVRNRIKRRLREAFRLIHPTMPAGYDLVIIVKPHTPKPMQEYRDLLAAAWAAIDTTAKKRRHRNALDHHDGR